MNVRLMAKIRPKFLENSASYQKRFLVDREYEVVDILPITAATGSDPALFIIDEEGTLCQLGSSMFSIRIQELEFPQMWTTEVIGPSAEAEPEKVEKPLTPEERIAAMKAAGDSKKD